jgi:hypothetical protein
LFSTAAGVRALDTRWLSLERSLAATRWEMLTRIVVPGVMGHVLTGIRLAIGITWIVLVPCEMLGVSYLRNPRGAARSFGLPQPEEGPNIAWWLRLKGVRDVVAGAAVLAVMALCDLRTFGIVLLVQSLIALGDMSVILAAKGSTKATFGIHGLTAAVMIVAALPLIAGAA